MTLTRGTPVRHAQHPHRQGVVCRFIDGRPVVAWNGDNDITLHDPDELDPDHERLAEWRARQGDPRS